MPKLIDPNTLAEKTLALEAAGHSSANLDDEDE